MIGIMNIKIEKVQSENNKISRRYKNMSEEKQMYQETNERLLVELKKYELQTNIMQQQINANLSKIILSQTQELDSSNLQ